MEFRKLYSRDRITSNAGSPFRNTYKYDYDEDGNKILVVAGKDNIYDQIQAEFENCDLHCILSRYAKGEIQDLNMRAGFYADLTKMPSNIFDMHVQVEAAHEMFDQLPLEVREQFDNSYSKFLSNYGSEHFMNVMDSYYNPPEVDVKEVPVESEVK